MKLQIKLFALLPFVSLTEIQVCYFLENLKAARQKMPAKKKDVQVVTRFTAFFDFALITTSDSNNNSDATNAQPICRLEFDIVAGEKCPKATENFRQLTAGVVTVGEKRAARQATYKGARLLRCTPEMIQLGDTTLNQSNPVNGDGKCQDTVFGTLIEDEAFGVVPHTFGTLSLCNSGPNSNGSQFGIIIGGGPTEDETENGNFGASASASNSNNSSGGSSLSHLDSRHVSLGFLRENDNPASSSNNNNVEALLKLKQVASSLVADRTGRLSGTGSFIIVADCGIL